MSDPGIERIVSDVRMEWVRQGSPSRTEEEMMRRAAQLAVAEERDACAKRIRASCKACDGTGVGGIDPRGDAVECEYCGRPMRAVRAGTEVGSE